MTENQQGFLFLILGEIACFACGIYGLIIGAITAALICFGIGLILPVWILWVGIGEEIKNASIGTPKKSSESSTPLVLDIMFKIAEGFANGLVSVIDVFIGGGTNTKK